MDNPATTAPPTRGATPRQSSPRWAHWRWQTDPDDPRAAPRRAARERAELRRRGVLQSLVGLVAMAVLLWLDLPVVAAIAGVIALGIGIAALASPGGAYRAISGFVDKIARAVGIGLTWLLLTPFYYLIVAPYGLLTRRGRKDRLERRPDRTLDTYWKRRTLATATPSAGNRTPGATGPRVNPELESYRQQF